MAESQKVSKGQGPARPGFESEDIGEGQGLAVPGACRMDHAVHQGRAQDQNKGHRFASGFRLPDQAGHFFLDPVLHPGDFHQDASRGCRGIACLQGRGLRCRFGRRLFLGKGVGQAGA